MAKWLKILLLAVGVLAVSFIASCAGLVEWIGSWGW